MKLWDLDQLKSLPKLKLAVIGHVEWMSFLYVDQLPKAGVISHSQQYLEEPAGGGALVALKMRDLIKAPVHFFTALGKDPTGEKCYERLETMGLSLKVGWRDRPTRKGISLVDSEGERAITVIGERLHPSANDPLPWDELSNFDGVFLTAADAKAIVLSRKAKLLAATPRVGIKALLSAQVKLDLLVGSGLDPGEKIDVNDLKYKPKIRIATEGELGGKIWPGGKFNSVKLKTKAIDSYGCGDNFAAGVTTGLAAKWDLEQSLSLGIHCGANCATHFGPYP
tara:strand:+ start:76611 stop:77453 length:843 start_codon:yes stop_codon:yes gene_type:complete